MENKVKQFCYHCLTETNQELLFKKGELTIPEIIPIDNEGKRKDSIFTIEAKIYKMSKCLGCEKMNFSAYRRTNPTESDILIQQYPSKQIRKIPIWITYLPIKYIDLMIEIYTSLNSGHSKLPLMGARTVLDIYIVDKIGDIGTFKAKLEKLLSENIISKSSKELLAVALEYGHATIHRAYQANINEINGVLDIIENLLHNEALVEKSKLLKKSIPK
jgi:hypothetical protein